MSDISVIEQRLAVVEQELSALKQNLGANGAKSSWLDRFVGAFKDDPSFDEVARLGEEYRRTQGPDTHG
jgi:hypothetical protein